MGALLLIDVDLLEATKTTENIRATLFKVTELIHFTVKHNSNESYAH